MNALNTLLAHASATLPDNITERKNLLKAMDRVMTPQHPAYAGVAAQLAAIETMEQMQRDLPLLFKAEIS